MGAFAKSCPECGESMMWFSHNAASIARGARCEACWKKLECQPPATELVPIYVCEWFIAPQPPIDVNPDVQHVCAKAYLAADVEAWLRQVEAALPEHRDNCHDLCICGRTRLQKLLAQLRGGGE